MLRVIMNAVDLSLDPISFHVIYERETGTGVTPDELAGLAGNFGNTLTSGGTTSIFRQFPPSIDHTPGACYVTATDITNNLDGSAAGSPGASVPFTAVGTPPLQPMPEGVAGTLSFRSDYGSDPEFLGHTRPRATHRNRIYLPVGAQALSNDATTKRTTLGTNWFTALNTWLPLIATIGDVVGGTGNTWKWVQWSKKAARVLNIIQAWADDRPDYQRRRTDPSGNKQQWGVTESGLVTVERYAWSREQLDGQPVAS